MQSVVSVVIPVYNGAHFLPGAVACVRSQDVPAEIIVVNDGSTDNTADIAAGLDVMYIAQDNAGPASARNRGLEAAHSELVAFLDVDDLWTPGALRTMCDHLYYNCDADIVQGRMQCVQIGPDGEHHTVDAPRRSTQVGSMLFRRAVFERVGLFDETLRYSEDTDWFMRAAGRGAAIASVGDVVLLYRLHAQSTTHGRTAGELGVLRVLRAAIERRRVEKDPG